MACINLMLFIYNYIDTTRLYNVHILDIRRSHVNDNDELGLHVFVAIN